MLAPPQVVAPQGCVLGRSGLRSPPARRGLRHTASVAAGSWIAWPAPRRCPNEQADAADLHLRYAQPGRCLVSTPTGENVTFTCSGVVGPASVTGLLGGAHELRRCGILGGRIVYISCNPTTLAPNAAQLVEAGWALRRVVPVDMLPQTPHIECVAVLDRAQPASTTSAASARSTPADADRRG